jgi:hypothetical protein
VPWMLCSRGAVSRASEGPTRQTANGRVAPGVSSSGSHGFGSVGGGGGNAAADPSPWSALGPDWHGYRRTEMGGR